MEKKNSFAKIIYKKTLWKNPLQRSYFAKIPWKKTFEKTPCKEITPLQKYLEKKHSLQRNNLLRKKYIGKKLYEKTSSKEITSFQKYFRTQNLLQKFLGKKLFECTP